MTNAKRTYCPVDPHDRDVVRRPRGPREHVRKDARRFRERHEDRAATCRVAGLLLRGLAEPLHDGRIRGLFAIHGDSGYLLRFNLIDGGNARGENNDFPEPIMAPLCVRYYVFISFDLDLYMYIHISSVV